MRIQGLSGFCRGVALAVFRLLALLLFAIILGGAAGFRIGWRVVFPGDQSRMDAAAAAGRSAAPVVAGVVLMLVIACMLEGFARQLIQIDLARYAIALATLVIWLGYFYTPGRRKVA